MAKPSLRQRVTGQLIGRLAEYEHGFKRKAFRVGVGLIVLYIVYLFCAGDYGLFRIHRLTGQRDLLNRQYRDLISETADCRYQLRRLRTDPHYVEYVARTRYRFSRPDDLIYHFDSDPR